jgi:Fic/DOC family
MRQGLYFCEEEHPAIGCARGICFRIHIHPYMDGNGRMKHFLMNVMMVAGGYPWTAIPLSAHHILE